MGDGGEAECERRCGYVTPGLAWCSGMSSSADVVQCGACGALETVSTPHNWEEAFADVPADDQLELPACARCGADALARSSAFDGLQLHATTDNYAPGALCPDCGARLVWTTHMIWD